MKTSLAAIISMKKDQQQSKSTEVNAQLPSLHCNSTASSSLATNNPRPPFNSNNNT